ncbi:hypothetical protein Tco_0891520 [Tanacetum coccineum]|uniref:Uncharacterized protein n=1 Tax=Tanacetum coccineum TaxID=301880 RepID=A0ABQ5C6E9_9ASTR
MYNNKKVYYGISSVGDSLCTRFAQQQKYEEGSIALYYPRFTKASRSTFCPWIKTLQFSKKQFKLALCLGDDPMFTTYQCHLKDKDTSLYEDYLARSKFARVNDETTHEEETDEDDTFDPIVHTPSRVSSSDDEDSDNEVEGMDAEGEKSDEDATYVEDQGNEAVKDTNANLEGRDDVMTDVILPQVQATQEIKDTHVTLTPVNPDGQQQSSSVSSGFVSNMLNPNQDTGVDAIFGQHVEATALIDIPVTAIAVSILS